MCDGQNLVDLVSGLPARAGWTTASQRRQAADPPDVLVAHPPSRGRGVAACPPARKPQGVSGHIIERQGQRLKPHAKPGRVDRIVG